MTLKRNRIYHECVSVDALENYLTQRCGDQIIRREKVARGQDPPDFWLSIDGKIFAVEETSIAEEATIKGNATARNKGSIHRFLGAKWEGDAQDEVTGLIQHAVSSVLGHKFCTIGVKPASVCGAKASALPPGFCPASAWRKTSDPEH
jgi:hypothetical protein